MRSVGAYVSAAAHNSRSADIAPGVYQLRKHMSATAALDLLLTPSAHLVDKVTIPEGSTEGNVITKLAAALQISPSAVIAPRPTTRRTSGCPTATRRPPVG